MYDYAGLHEGVYHIQSGFRNDTALIHCPYISNRIEVVDASSLNILDGAAVYWREVRHFYVFKKNSNRKEMIINAVVVGQKHCKYICDGINIICTLAMQQTANGSQIYARPLNKKLPMLEIIDDNGYSAAYPDAFDQWDNIGTHYYWVRILCWNYQENYPKASVTGVFQRAKTAEAETEAILHSLDIEQREVFMNFQKNILPTQYLPIRDHEPFQETVFTIDPPGSIDMEDALSVKAIGEGNYEVGVHIADVSSFMHLVNRRQISLRGSSIYLPHKTIHMLPIEITQLCSFQEKKQRLAFSVFFIMSEEGTILSTTFKKTIITNTAQLSYAQAQDIIDGKLQKSLLESLQFQERHGLTKNQAAQIENKLNILKKIAFSRRKVRKSQEILDRNEVTFELDENKLPIAIGIKKRFDSERLVEELMIAANGEVARKIVQDYGSNALIIHHPKPTEYSINNLNSFVSDFGVQFKTDSFMNFETEMKKLIEQEGIKDQFKEALRMKAIQIQELATYTRHMDSQKGHYGLNMEYYTHFTSPLRRFADIIVHEQLDHCLTQGTKPKYNMRLDEEIEFVNRARARNKKMKQLVVECFLNLFLFQQGDKISVKALVMSLGLKSVTVYIPLYNLVKEINWSTEVKANGKESVKLWRERREFVVSKNDSIDVEIEADVHQEVKVSLLVKNENGDHFKI